MSDRELREKTNCNEVNTEQGNLINSTTTWNLTAELVTKVEVPLEDMWCQEKTNQRDRIGIMKKYINENILFIFASPFLPRPCSFLQILEITVVTTTDWSVALRYPSLSGRFLWPVRFLPAPLQSTSTLLPHQSHIFRMVNIPRRFSFCSSYPGFP